MVVRLGCCQFKKLVMVSGSMVWSDLEVDLEVSEY